MPLPKVTLLGKAGNTFTLVFGRTHYEFTAGKSRRVPVPVAIAARKKSNPESERVFKVEEMPTVVVPSHEKKEQVEPPLSPPASEQNETVTVKKQTVLEGM